MDTPGKVFYFGAMINRILIVVVLIGGALAFTWYSRYSLQQQLVVEVKETLLERLPPATFTTLEGSAYDLIAEQGFEGKTLLVHFWATWCGPCEAELPELLALTDKLPANVRVLIVAINDEVPKIRKFLASLKLPLNKEVLWLMDNRNVHRDQFGTTKLPESYVFKADGSILRKLVGPQEWGNPHFIDIFKGL